MKFAAQEDIEATLEQTFEALTDFERMERAALRRGTEVIRTDSLTSAGAGMAWQAKFPFRGRERVLNMEITTFDAPNQLVVFSKVQGMEGTVEIDLVPLSRQTTRMNLSLDLRPRTITSRLLLQPLKVARSRVAKRFKGRVADFARAIEERHNT